MNTASGKYPLRGVVVTLSTPFTSHDRIDWPAVESLVAYHLADRAVGFLVPAEAGEVRWLRREERIDLLRCVRELTRGQCKLIAGATSDDSQEALTIANAALKFECDAVLAEVPAYCGRNRQLIVEFFAALADAGPPVLMIQDLDWSAGGIELDTLVELAHRIPSFRCLKIEVHPSGPKYTAIRRAIGADLHLSGGWAALQMIEGLDRGVDAFMTCALVGLYGRIFDCYDRGDRVAAIAWFHKILPVLAFTRQHLSTSIQFYKRLFLRRGLLSTAMVRDQHVPYDDWHERYAEELLHLLEGLEAELHAGCE